MSDDSGLKPHTESDDANATARQVAELHAAELHGGETGSDYGVACSRGGDGRRTA
jgi:hypothetical protein